MNFGSILDDEVLALVGEGRELGGDAEELGVLTSLENQVRSLTKKNKRLKLQFH